VSEPIPDAYDLVEHLTAAQVGELLNLLRQQWWGTKRTLDEVQTMLDNTSLMVGLVEKSSGRLVGFSRVLTDFTCRAMIYDVMVVEDCKGLGLGKRLLDALTDHPKLQRVSLVYLCCEPKMFPFYERWGFAEYSGRAEWMLKIQRPEVDD
jgi:GNAT superfamily N-acetyltransferase